MNNKKLSRLLEPNLKLVFICMLLFAAVTAPVKPVLALAEACATAALYVYLTRATRSGARAFYSTSTT